jgi:SAM-dependent methyltransferase
MASVVDPAPAEALSERLFTEGLGAAHMLTAFLGVKLGLFRALTDHGPATAAELAERTALDQRYVREWLQAETIAGLLEADADDLAAARFTARPGVRETLVDETNPMYLGGLTQATAALGPVMTDLLDAFRTGSGIPYERYGAEAVSAQAALNRPAFVNSLVAEWLPAMPDVLARLEDSARPARVADVGCGVGWAAIELARAFPHIRVDGLDVDESSLREARRNAADQGLAERVTFTQVDVKAGFGEQRYDVIFFFECLHDMPRPAEALASARTAMVDGGFVIVMDERVGATLPPPGDPNESYFATVSVLWCLPQSRAEPDCEAPGTVMRPAALRAFAERAGWRGVEVLPVEHPFFRFYRMRD